MMMDGGSGKGAISLRMSATRAVACFPPRNSHRHLRNRLPEIRGLVLQHVDDDTPEQTTLGRRFAGLRALLNFGALRDRRSFFTMVQRHDARRAVLETHQALGERIAEHLRAGAPNELGGLLLAEHCVLDGWELGRDHLHNLANGNRISTILKGLSELCEGALR